MGETLAAHRGLDLTVCHPHHFDSKGLLNEPVEMRGWILPWVTAAKYKSASSADGYCHVWENSEGLPNCPHLITSNFQGVHFFEIFRTCHIRAVLKLTHTHVHTHSSLLVVGHSCGRKIQTLAFSQTYTQSCTCLFFNCTQTVESLSNCMSCQSHPHSYLQMPTDGGKDYLFLF